MIYFMCPDIMSPTGGIKQIYRQVDILNEARIDAAVMHTRPGFRCAWFSNTTPIVHTPSVTLNEGHDIVVIPEIYGARFKKLFPGVRKVPFVQGGYLLHKGFSLSHKQADHPYDHPDIIAVLAISADTVDQCRYAFENLSRRLPIYRVSNSIDPSLFYHQAQKKNQIAFMPRRGAWELREVINVLRFRGTLIDWTVARIHGMTHEEVAQTLRESRIFIATGLMEGWPLPPAEAMASGCFVVGYHGQGGKEYFEFGRAVEPGNVRALAKEVESVIAMSSEERDDHARAGSDFIHQRYSPEQEGLSILSAWQKILSS